MPMLATREETQTAPPRQNTISRTHPIGRGAELQPDGSVRFSIWAPAVETMQMEIDGVQQHLVLEAKPGGWHEITTRQASAGSRYSYILPNGTRVPDPASRFQPHDVHGPSEVIDPAAYAWKDKEWKGRPWHEAVLYELHIGTFTDQGTFLAAIEKLDHLVELGVTGIEIMPIADFAGKRNWGYDGVLLYAPDSSYGRPEDLKRLIEAAHSHGLFVILDVVYNHFGPEGNYLPVYAPQTLTGTHTTSWGDAINYDNEGKEVVRDFAIQNALYWIGEFHFDGLRLDAVHAIKDSGPRHLLDELADRVRAAHPDRFIHLILENEDNQASRLERNQAGEPTHYTAQWNDDMHHVLHTAATLESNGYYADYSEDNEKLARALAEGFAFQGEVMQCKGSERGEPCAHLPPTAFVAFMQNHDQIGNRAFGERINAIASPEAVHAIASVYLLLPQIPMLFMGEEWGSSQPFPFFCDFEGELGNLVREGRRKEFESFPEFRDPEQRERIPDPLSVETFLSGKLDWQQVRADVHAEWLDWYKHILGIRKQVVVALINQIGGHAGQSQIIGNGAVAIRWALHHDRQLVLAANLSDSSVEGFPEVGGELIWQEGPEPSGSTMRPWSVRWSLQQGETTTSPLDGLAERCGIESSAVDARGNTLVTSPETKRALLEAMGLDASDDDAAAASLKSLQAAAWTHALPAVQVAYATAGPVHVPLVLPEDTQEVSWTVVLEEGATHTGRSPFGALPLLDQFHTPDRNLQRRALQLPADLPWGYHTLSIDGADAALSLIVSPGRCWLPEAYENGPRIWGIAAQLYLQRSRHNWGIGDFTDLRQLIELTRERGADVVGVNPLHAMFVDKPEEASPYSPSDRNLLNVLNIDVEAIPELASSEDARRLIASEEFRSSLAHCREAANVAYEEVAHLKMKTLKLLFDTFEGDHGSDRQKQFDAFHTERAELLDRACTFQALRAYFAGQDPRKTDSNEWPEEYRTHRSPAVARFAEEHQDLVRFQLWLQWIADSQLHAASTAAREMIVGIYRDLAVGAHASGAEVWTHPDALVGTVRIGAPPDIWNAAGQDWGLPPLHPQRLREAAFKPFIELLRCNMRYAGALRIDHAMALQRLYWIPKNARPTDGAYVAYPTDDLIGILALESHRNRCLVIGEDLGTVPRGFRERMERANILSYRVLFFERDEEAFAEPSTYPKLSLSVASSHDLPTLAGWWHGRDLARKETLNLFLNPEQAEEARLQRSKDRDDLVRRLVAEGLMTEGQRHAAEFPAAVNSFLARTASFMTLMQLDDITGEVDQVNIPATTTETPNWRRRQRVSMEDLGTYAPFLRLADNMREERGRPMPGQGPEL